MQQPLYPQMYPGQPIHRPVPVQQVEQSPAAMLALIAQRPAQPQPAAAPASSATAVASAEPADDGTARAMAVLKKLSQKKK